MLSSGQQTLFDVIARMAAEHGAAGCRMGVAGIFIPAQNPKGISVRVCRAAEGWRMFFDRVEVLLYDADDVIDYVRMALDGELRLRVDVTAGRAWQWTLEAIGETGHWSQIHAEGLINWRFWGHSDTHYLCNAATGRALRDVAEKAAVLVPTRQRPAQSAHFSS